MLFSSAYLVFTCFVLFGAVLYIVDFHKRGHAHIFIWHDLDKDHQVSAALIDSFVSTTIPYLIEDHLGYCLVSEFTMHGPCGELNDTCVCMKNDEC
jgi:cbb3-type cytochrome oxidase subunit 1